MNRPSQGRPRFFQIKFQFSSLPEKKTCHGQHKDGCLLTGAFVCSPQVPLLTHIFQLFVKDVMKFGTSTKKAEILRQTKVSLNLFLLKAWLGELVFEKSHSFL